MQVEKTPGNASHRILLVDDHTVVRQGTREMLNSHPHLEVVGEASDGEDLAGLIKLKQPDLLLLDINLPGKNGLQLLAEIRPAFPTLKIVLFSAHTDLQYLRKAIELQTDGYLSKTIDTAILQESIVGLLEGKTPAPVLSADVAERLQATGERDKQSRLTAREHETLLQVALGHTNQAIAKNLSLSVKTVDTHVANLMKKLEVNNRAQLVALAYENGWV